MNKNQRVTAINLDILKSTMSLNQGTDNGDEIEFKTITYDTTQIDEETLYINGIEVKQVTLSNGEIIKMGDHDE